MSNDRAEPSQAQILIVDDMPDNLDLLCQTLESEGLKVIAAPNGEVALRIAAHVHPDLILLDIIMPKLDGFEICRRLKADARLAEILIIFITARNEAESVVKGFQVGGLDYITKPFREAEVLARVQTHLKINRLTRELLEKNAELAAFNEKLRREKGPFIPVNCAAIPAELAESLFFGHVKGAFTGAMTDRKGYFELADGGTLFLDEIGEMSLGLQAKLLRALEDGSFVPLGATREKRVNVRTLAATNVDLQARLADGKFRSDLYFRLAQFRLVVPPLRERPEDIPLLAEHFLKMFAMEMGMEKPTLSREALAALETYHFPGNVRELKHIIEGALIKSSGLEIQSEHLHFLPEPFLPPSESGLEIPFNMQQAEVFLIKRALKQAAGNISEAARLLGISRPTLYGKLARTEGGSDTDK